MAKWHSLDLSILTPQSLLQQFDEEIHLKTLLDPENRSITKFSCY